MEAKEREKILEEIYQTAYDYESEYGFCAQAVLGALHDYFEEIDSEIIKASHPLAAGGAMCGDGACGALLGGMLAIGSYFGRRKDQFGDSDEEYWTGSSRLANKVREKFIEEYGSVLCGDVQELLMGRTFDLWDTADYKNFEKAGGHDDKCPDVTGKVAKWTAEVLLDQGIKLLNNN